jgi:hypothetical protein
MTSGKTHEMYSCIDLRHLPSSGRDERVLGRAGTRCRNVTGKKIGRDKLSQGDLISQANTSSALPPWMAIPFGAVVELGSRR